MNNRSLQAGAALHHGRSQKRGGGGLIDASHWRTRESCGARGLEGAEEARARPRHGSAPPRATAVEHPGLPCRRTVRCGKELGLRVCHRLAEFLRARGDGHLAACRPPLRKQRTCS